MKRKLISRADDLSGKPRETTRAVAAHFRFAAIAIVIPHPKIGAVLPRLEQKNSIRTDAAMPVANAHDLLRLEPHIAGAIVDHNEIVARAVHFGEAQLHMSILRAALCSATGGSAAPRAMATNAASPPIFSIEQRSARSTCCDKRRQYLIVPVRPLAQSGVAASLALLAQFAHADNLNSLVLEQVHKLPSGGRYSVSHFATIKLQSAAHFESGKFFVIPTAPYPSFCSGATYIVFIKTIEALRDRGPLQLDFATLEQL